MRTAWMFVALGAATAFATACGSGPIFGSGRSSFGGDDDIEGPEIGPDEPPDGLKGPQPTFGNTVRAADAPPPISGGTLLVTHDGTTAVAADPDRDHVYLVDLASSAVTTLDVTAHDEPGRLVEDDAGRVHVVLRNGGAIATIDLASKAVLARRPVCAGPRGIAFDKDDDRLVIACETGEIVTLGPSPDATPTTLTTLDRGLRDVVMGASGAFWVSRFRTAEVMLLGRTGALVSTTRPTGIGEATLGWRMIASPSARSAQPLLVHQLASTTPVSPTPGGYGSPAPQSSSVDCEGGSIVNVALTQGASDPVMMPSQLVLPVDMAADASRYAIVSAGNGHTAALPQVFLVNADAAEGQSPCDGEVSVDGYNLPGQPIAVAFGPTGGLIVQSREPAELVLPSGPTTTTTGFGADATNAPAPPRIITLSTVSREDTGHAIFHSNSGSGLACASCHGEGGDDGHVWEFDSLGQRRTPSLHGTLNGTAPYHWGGEMTDIAMLTQDVLTGRMNGPSLNGDQVGALQGWLFALPTPVPQAGVDPASAARGQALFQSADVGCSSCHAGAMLTNSATVDVGTGGAFQVPSLIGVSARTPLLHDGCAKTLEDRFGVCATPAHGKTAQLGKQDIADLVSYLKTL